MTARGTLIGAVLVFAFALGTSERAQSSFQSSNTSDQEKCVIEGVVTSAPTGEPLKGAQVYPTAPGKYKPLYSAESDATGHFSIENIEPGEYQLSADKTGYYDPERKCDSEEIQSEDEIRLTPGQKLADLNLRLVAPAVITGTVVDPLGEPVVNAEIETVRISSHSGRREIAPAGTSQSDDRGQFRIFHLEPGQYFVRVASAGSFRPRARNDEESNPTEPQGFLPIYYPDTTDINSATTLELTAGGDSLK